MEKTSIEFIPTLDDGGAETLVKDYCVISNTKGLGRLIPVVLWGTTNSANIKCFQNYGISILKIYNRINAFTRAFNRIFGKIYVPMKMQYYVKKYNVGVIHFHLGILAYAKRISKINKGIYFYYTCHNVKEHYFPNKKCTEYLTVKKLLDERRITLVALHETMRDELVEMFNTESVIVVNNGVSFERFNSVLATQDEIRGSIGIPQDAFLVGHVGRFMNQKNHEFLINVFSRLVKRKENAHLLLVGAGELEDSIREQIRQNNIEKKVTILAHRTDVNELMKAMDVFVFPSFFEGLSVVLVEAQASGLKCIVSANVSRASSITDLVHYISLDEPIEKWIDEILLAQGTYNKLDNYDNFNADKVVENLCHLYEVHY